MLNDEHVQLHLFPVLRSKKFLALCVEHPNTRSILPHPGPTISLCRLWRGHFYHWELCSLQSPEFWKKKCYVVKGHSSLFHSALTLSSQLTIISFWNHRGWPCLYVTRALLVPHYEQRAEGKVTNTGNSWLVTMVEHNPEKIQSNWTIFEDPCLLFCMGRAFALPVSSFWRKRTKMALSLVLSVLAALKYKGTFHLSSVSWQLSNTKGLRSTRPYSSW